MSLRLLILALLALGGCPEKLVDVAEPDLDPTEAPPKADDEAPTARVEQPPAKPEDAPKPSKRLDALPSAEKLSKAITTHFAGNVGRRIHLHTDKPLYKPGETIWLSTWDLAARDLSGAAAGTQDATLELISPKGAAVITQRLQRSAGRAQADLPLPDGVPGGEYTLRLTAADGVVGERPVIVSNYEAPRVKKKLEFVRKAYGPGDEVSATIEVKRPTGEPLAAMGLTAAIRLDGADLPRVRVTTNSDGGAMVRFPLPDSIARGDGLLTVLVQDGGVTESISKRIPIVLRKVELGFFPEGGVMVQGLPTRLYFEAKNPLGKPADVEGRIVDDRGQAVASFSTYDRGLGRIAFTPAVGRSYHAVLTRPVGITETTPLPLAEESGCVLRHYDDLDGTLTEARVAVSCTEERDVVVTAMVRENLLDAAALHVSPGTPAVAWLKDEEKAARMGVARITLFDDALTPLAERIVFRGRRSRLAVQITPDQEAYVPGEQVALRIATRGPDGAPVSADLSLAVVDDTVISFADDKTGHMLSRLYLEPEIPGDVEEPNVYFDLTEEKGALGMELLMGTRGWRRFAWEPVLNPPPPVAPRGSGSAADWGGADGAFFGGMDLEGEPMDAVAEEVEKERAPRDKEVRPRPAAPPARRAPAPPPQADPMPEAEPAIAEAKPRQDPNVMAGEAMGAAMPAEARARGGLGKRAEMADEDWDDRMANNVIAYAPVRQFPVPAVVAERVGPRTDFRETIFWAPSVRTDATGEATLTFPLSDAVTSFRATAEGVGAGAAGRQEEVITSKLPFSMSVKLPLAVSEGDLLELPLTLTNEQDTPLPVSLSATFGELLSPTKPASLPGSALAAGSRDTVWHTVQVRGEQGESVVRFAANAGGLEDAFERTVTVEPLGFPQQEEAAGTLAKAASHTMDLGAGPLKGAAATLTLYPSPVATLVTGLEGMIREPSGCFEQTSSTNYPNIMVLKYLEANDVAAPELITRTQGMLDRGYKKLVGFESDSKGYEWFGRAPAHEALTAYGLLEFADMRDVYGDVDPGMVKRTAEWLGKRRDGKGGFSRDGKALDSFGRAGAEVTDAYIVYSLAEAGMLAGFDQELARQRDAAAGVEDPYLLALAANTLLNAPGEADRGLAAAKRLAAMQGKDGRWTGADHSITRSGGNNLDIETTALALLALLDAGGHDAAVRSGVQWLNANRGGYGQWGATQATVLALKAMTEYTSASRVMKGSGAVTLRVNGQDAGTQRYEEGRKDPLVFAGWEKLLTSGSNRIELSNDGEVELPYSLVVDYRSDKPADHPDAAVQIATLLERTEVPMGESVRLVATVTNTTKEGQPMTLARVGLPGGLSSQTWQLKELREKGTIAFFETREREVVLYLDGLAPGEVRELPLDLVAQVPGTYTGPASSGYLYYTNDQRTWAPGLAVQVTRP